MWRFLRRLAGHAAPALAAPSGRPRPLPDALAAAVDRSLRDLDAAPALDKAAALERAVKLQGALVVDLRNRAAALEREIGALRAAIRVNAMRAGAAEAEVERVLAAARGAGAD